MAYIYNILYKVPPKKFEFFQNAQVCPYCNNSKIYLMRRNMYKCSSCRKEWSPRKGTILEHSKLSVDKYNKIVLLIAEGYSAASIAKKLACNYYAVYKLYYKIKKNNVPQNKYLIYTLKSKTQETNFSLAQNTGLSKSTIARLVSQNTKYKINTKSYQILYEHLTNDAQSIVSLNNKVFDQADSVQKQNKPLSSIFKIKRHFLYAVDILLLADLIERNQFAKSIPESFFFDYLYKSCINSNTMKKALIKLKRHNFIQSFHGIITKSYFPITYFSYKKRIRLITSLAMYFSKIGDYPSAFGWMLMNKNKKLIDEYFIQSIFYYETKSDVQSIKYTIEYYEKKFKRTTKYLHAFLLYQKLYISNKYSLSLPKSLKYIKLFLKILGVFSNFFSHKFLKKLDYEIHAVFIYIYDYFNNLNCLNFAIKVKDYFLSTINIYDSKYSLYHHINPLLYYLDTNNFDKTELLINELKKIPLENQDKYKQNAYYTTFLFYYAVYANKRAIKTYTVLLEKNGKDCISLPNKFRRFEILCIVNISNNKLDHAIISFFLWFNELYDNKINSINALIYIRIILKKLGNKCVIQLIHDFFTTHTSKNTYFALPFEKEKALKGLEHLLKVCKVNSQQNTVPADSLIHWIDNFMIAFRQKTYTKKMLKSSTYRFIRKIRKIDKNIKHADDEDFLQILKSILSHNPNETANPIPHASSENLILLHSSYYCLYEHLFLAEKTVSKKFPPIVPHYIQRLLEQR